MQQRRAWRASAIAALLLWCPADALARQAGGTRNRAASVRGLSALKQAQAWLDAGDLNRARSQIEAVLARDAASAEAHFLMGLLCERLKDFTAAATAYATAIGYAPRMAQARDRLGFVLGQQGKTAEALRQFEEAIHVDPTLFDAQYHLGATRWWTRDFAGALPALEAAVRLRPEHAEARYYLGLTLQAS